MAHGPDPVGHRAGQGFDVGGQRCIECQVGRRVLTNDVDDTRAGLLGVVQIGEAVGEPRSEMQ